MDTKEPSILTELKRFHTCEVRFNERVEGENGQITQEQYAYMRRLGTSCKTMKVSESAS